MANYRGRDQRRRGPKRFDVRESDEMAPAKKYARMDEGAFETWSEVKRDDSPGPSPLTIEDFADPVFPVDPIESVARARGVWEMMCRKDEVYGKRRNPLAAHAHISSRSRAILLDWIMEVSATEHFHRETFHLAVDYLDRYLTAYPNEDGIGIHLENFQMVGATALHIAAKYEEIYPPSLEKLIDYADGACHLQEVLECELLMLEALSFLTSPVTAIHWLTYFMQQLGQRQFGAPPQEDDGEFSDTAFKPVVPKIMREEFVYLALILDLCLMDADSTNYTYRQLAACVLFYAYEPADLVEEITGISYVDMAKMLEWLEPFCLVAKKRRRAGDPLPVVHDVPADDWHNVQTRYEADIESIFMDVSDQRKQVLESQQRSLARPSRRRL